MNISLSQVTELIPKPPPAPPLLGLANKAFCDLTSSKPASQPPCPSCAKPLASTEWSQQLPHRYTSKPCILSFFYPQPLLLGEAFFGQCPPALGVPRPTQPRVPTAPGPGLSCGHVSSVAPCGVYTMSFLRTEAWGFPFRITSTTQSTVTIMTASRILLLMFSYIISFSKSPLSLQELWRGQTIWPRSHSQQAAELGFEGNGAASGRGEKGLR